MNSSILASIDPPANVLLVHRSDEPAPACTTLCQSCASVAELRVCFGDRHDHATSGPSASDGPDKLGLISVGDVLRAGQTTTGPDYTAPFVVDAIDDPTDLTQLGVTISEFCEAWGAMHTIRVCFHSLDDLLAHTAPEDAFHFVYVLMRRLSSVDAIAHFHLDPSSHDDRIVSTFGAVFDEVVVDDDGIDVDVPEATDDDVADIISTLDTASAEWSFEAHSIEEQATDEDVANVLEK